VLAPAWSYTRAMRISAASVIALLLLSASTAHAVTSSRSVPSDFGGNGHNASFDGRLYVIRDSNGWQARLLRPEAASFGSDGLPNASGAIWSPTSQILGPGGITENALAICEPDKTRASFACNEAGAPSVNGPFACYDVMLIDSDAVTPAAQGGFVMRRRHMTLWVQSPKTANASIYKFALDAALQPLGPALKGIEPTFTADGKLMVYQGHPANNGDIDILMYSVNASACAQMGWSAPKPISSMATDPKIMGKYRLGDRALRAADGTTFAPGALVHGAYPWLMPTGDAIIFAAAPMACRATEDPPGCGPRRNAVSVVGYPTNWGIAHIDGGVNPSTDNNVRLFFSSPGPKAFAGIPATKGLDVWPFFGSNTSNYVELVFDDGLDGKFAGLWHLNESVNAAGDLDKTRTPDVSGYFNTGILRGGLSFAAANDGVIGKSLVFDGIDDNVEVADAPSLSPVNGITIDFQIRPTASPDCDAKNNYRVVIGKGDIGSGSYTVVLEDNGALNARVSIGGVQKNLPSPGIALQTWTHASFEYDGPTGKAAWFFDGKQVATGNLGSGTIKASTSPLRIGGPGPRAACPPGDGAFAGQLDEVSISRISRHFYVPPVGVDAGAPDGSMPVTPGNGSSGNGAAPPGADGDGVSGNGDADAASSDGCTSSPSRAPVGWGLAAALAFLSLAVGRSAARARRRSR
jgi:Concanavalin A-like lectin/glucanases superfamily